MKHRGKLLAMIWAAAVLLWPLALPAQLEVRANPAAQSFFAGEGRTISVQVHNPAGKATQTDLRTQLYQTSSATVIPLGEAHHWKKLEVLPGQTVLESAPMAFPPVKQGTRFLLQWLDEQNKTLGRAEVMVYPTNLLQALKPLAGEMPLGIYDPQNQLKPLLKGLALGFEDLADAGLDSFSGKLAIIGPFQSAPISEGLTNQVRALAKKGRAIVWLQAPSEKWGTPPPSYYSVPNKESAVVIVQRDLTADLLGNPQAQLNLIYFCQLAVHPEDPALPKQSN